jgi:hypothetical protein
MARGRKNNAKPYLRKTRRLLFYESKDDGMIEKAKQTLTSFLESWKTEDYRDMEKHVQLTWLDGRGNTCHEQLRRLFMHRQLESFEILEGIPGLNSNARIDFRVKVQFRGNNVPLILERAVVICEYGPYLPSEKGEWGVNPASVLRMGKAG